MSFDLQENPLPFQLPKTTNARRPALGQVKYLTAQAAGLICLKNIPVYQRRLLPIHKMLVQSG